jgi:hypothetical protein
MIKWPKMRVEMRPMIAGAFCGVPGTPLAQRARATKEALKHHMQCAPHVLCEEAANNMRCMCPIQGPGGAGRKQTKLNLPRPEFSNKSVLYMLGT